LKFLITQKLPKKMKTLVTAFMAMWLLACQDTDDSKPIESIAESKMLDINGTKQFVMIRGEDSQKPVLLHLHGGPGVSELGGMRKYNKDLEKDFVVVYWDQRNAGKSYVESFPKVEIKVSKYIEDVNTLANYLKDRLNVSKIFLVGHSWGSRLGMYAIQKYPAQFSAFVSTGQEVAAADGELQSYQYTLAKAKELKKTDFVQQLEAMGEPKGGDYRTMYRFPEAFSLQKYILLELNKDIYDGFTIEDLYANIDSDEYTATDKANYLKAAEFTNEHIANDADFHNFDFRKQLTEVKIPVFFIAGKYDYINPTPLAKQYFDLLKAPKKEFILYEKSGHDPAWEEAQRFNAELVRIYKIVK
jgi:proline iminopeptidase